VAVDPTSLAELGSSGITVTRLGLGTGPATRGLTREDAGRFADTVRHASSLGIRYVDTAPAYHLGASEEALGEVARESGDALVISTKVGRLVRPGVEPTGTQTRDPSSDDLVFDFSRDGIVRSVEESLERLGLERVDVLMIHDPDDHMDQAIAEAYPALRELKDQGHAGAIGAGMTAAPPLARFVRETELDCLLLAGRYTLLEQSALDELLPLCVERNVSVILGGVFNGGLLAGSSTDLFNYARADESVLAAARELSELCDDYGVPLKAAAIQFPFAHPAIASVLSGTVAKEHLDENAELMRVEIPAELWERMRATGHIRAEAPLPASRSAEKA
jgi:D-threo-aldose 1-dehydrogenase